MRELNILNKEFFSLLINSRRISLVLSIAIILCIGICCEDYSKEYSYSPPVKRNDGINTGILTEARIDSQLVFTAVNKIINGEFKGIHSFLIYKDNMLVLEEYFEGYKYKWDGRKHHGEMVIWDKDTPHHIMSAAKSVTSACVGIAIDNGFIKSVHESIFNYLPNHQHFKTGGKSQITIEHLLTMTSGLEWHEWRAPLSSSRNDLIGLWFQDIDPVTAILDRPLKHTPGTKFKYSGGNMILLGEIIKNAANMNFEEFSVEYLLKPLGIDSAYWADRFDNGVVYAGGGLVMKPRDMMKFGITYLNDGVWNDEQLIPKPWVEKSKVPYGKNHKINIPEEPSGRQGYSYSWWIKEINVSGKQIRMFSAGGWGGQHIFVLPELEAVVVFTGGNYKTYRPPFEILEDFILPALVKNE